MRKLMALVAVCSLASLSACTSTPQTKKEVGQLNFSYKPSGQEKKVDKIISIVSPSYKSASEEATNNQQSYSQPSLMALASMNAKNAKRANVNFNKNLGHYGNRLTSAMGETFHEIIISKGFKISGSYETFDDITYGDKKTSYLALVPDLNIYVDQKIKSKECSNSNGYCENVGTIQIGGSLNIRLIEPLTKQTFFSKRINLSKLTAPKDYVQRYHYRAKSDSLLGMAVNSLTAGDKKPLIDNTDKVLVEALNEFFAKSMKKVDGYISTQEVMSFEKDVMAIKNLKRF